MFIASHFCFVRKETVSNSLVKISMIFVHSCPDETRMAVFSVPFPQTKFPNVFVPGYLLGFPTTLFPVQSYGLYVSRCTGGGIVSLSVVLRV